LFPPKKDSFPRPTIILSDRAALYVFNDENYSAFHDMRKRVNKYLPEEAREISMWVIALLVNTSTWPEIKDNWRLICQVFLIMFQMITLISNNIMQHYFLVLIIDEEEELNKADSPLKQELQAIYNEWLTTCIKYNGAFSSFDKASKGTRQWLSHINQSAFQRSLSGQIFYLVIIFNC
ncbi:unnamed protein product, partial [Rotaria magnacalcarata]